MAREGRHINAAGGFLRALRQAAGPGGQAVGASPLPVKEILRLLREHPRLRSEVADDLAISAAEAARSIENLRGLGLVEVEPTGEGDRAKLTGLGREVADQQRGG